VPNLRKLLEVPEAGRLVACNGGAPRYRKTLAEVEKGHEGFVLA